MSVARCLRGLETKKGWIKEEGLAALNTWQWLAMAGSSVGHAATDSMRGYPLTRSIHVLMDIDLN